MSKLILVGAGPGDEELITLKGIRAIEQANVVLYDALANENLLKYCAVDCKKIYVGKKAGIHAYQQIYINDMIVDFAKEYGTVVRLKGGDPYIFGRGHEELEHARANGLEVEVIPGISSAIAVPAMAGIPLTKRGINDSFWVVTGTTTSGEFSKDLCLAAQSSATVVILMGMQNLPDIVTLFQKYRGLDEPVGIIQKGTTTDERSGFGSLETIEQVVIEKELSSPAIIVIGQVVNERTCKEELAIAAILA